MIVLDTNVVSELMRASPAAAVASWVRQQERGSLVTTAITIAEIRYGLARLPAGRRTRQLWETAEEVLAAFPSQVLPFDQAAAVLYGDIAAARERIGRPIDAFDAQIAAISRAHRARLATRNTKDFDETGIRLVDPWRT
ncbi:MAG: type II toxin-antitoxin system VapC family toxin [Actinobacteria bacterium]|nr:type II toxin-antitoxin system VapC family toxin [Actinomycetota bacterium]